jgi:DNA-binding transcriptional MerR regulator
MNEAIPDKNYFRIGEVSKILQVEPYVVRYWESEFKTIKPIRTSADQRLYRRRDVEQLMIIKNLLYQEGFTIAGARKKLLGMKNEGSEREEDYRLKLLALKRGLLDIKNLVD